MRPPALLRKWGQRAVGSAVHRAHVFVALPAGRAFRCCLVDPLQVLARKGDPERGHVLLQVLAALGARDGNEALRLGQEPREGQLGRRHLLRGGDLLHPVHEFQVLLEVLALEPWSVATPVVLWQILEASQLAGEEAAAERAVRDEADAQFQDGGDEFVLWVAAPQRILGLQGGDRARAQCGDAVCHHLVRRLELGAARRQDGQRAACRVPDNEGRCAGNGFRGYGRLIYLSTGLSRRARDGMITLGTAKAALDQFVRYIAMELARHGITANLVAPATVEGTRVTEQLTAERMRELAAPTPMRRLVRPDEVAKTVAFLASEHSGFTTGHYLPVNGGLAMD